MMNARIQIIELLDTGIMSTHVHKYIRDPIHIYIPFTRLEEQVIDSKIFQRLRRIHQLQVAYTVYPGATHSRFLHSVGVMHLAGKFALALLRTSHAFAGQKAPCASAGDTSYSVPLFDEIGLEEERDIVSILIAVRLGGLLHDVGHMPYSHAFDEAIISRSKKIRSLGIQSHEDTSYFIYKNFLRDNMIRFMERHYDDNLVDADIVIECLDHIMKPRRLLGRPKRIAYEVMRHVVKEFVYPADIIDFCLRDSYFTGAVEYGRIDVDRLFVFSMIVEKNKIDTKGEKKLYIGLLRKAIGALRAFLYSRLWLFNNVYFHKFSRLMDYVIKELLVSIYDKQIIDFEGIYEGIVRGEEEILDLLEKMDDNYILFKALESNDGKLRELAKRILYRKPYLREIYSQEITILQSDIEHIGDVDNFDVVIRNLKETIGEILEIDTNDIFIDSPPIKFFPLNPYLPYSMFPLIDVERHKIVSVSEANAWVITSARITDFAVFRVLIPRHVLERIGMPDDKIRRLISSIITKDFEKTIKQAFIAKYSRFKYEVTM